MKTTEGHGAGNTLYHLRCSLLPVPCSCGEQFACFPPGSNSSSNADISSPPQNEEASAGEITSQFGLSTPRSLISSAVTSESTCRAAITQALGF